MVRVADEAAILACSEANPLFPSLRPVKERLRSLSRLEYVR
jgi:hypothetical protein